MRSTAWLAAPWGPPFSPPKSARPGRVVLRRGVLASHEMAGIGATRPLQPLRLSEVDRTTHAILNRTMSLQVSLPLRERAECSAFAKRWARPVPHIEPRAIAPVRYYPRRFTGSGCRCQPSRAAPSAAPSAGRVVPQG